jgi:hypothetical protein
MHCHENLYSHIKVKQSTSSQIPNLQMTTILKKHGVKRGTIRIKYYAAQQLRMVPQYSHIKQQGQTRGSSPFWDITQRRLVVTNILG